MGLLFGQFVGFRFILPRGIEEKCNEYFATEFERQHGISILDQFALPGMELPAFFADLSEREVEALGSVAAGSLAGYITSRMKGNQQQPVNIT